MSVITNLQKFNLCWLLKFLAFSKLMYNFDFFIYTIYIYLYDKRKLFITFIEIWIYLSKVISADILLSWGIVKFLLILQNSQKVAKI